MHSRTPGSSALPTTPARDGIVRMPATSIV